MSIYTPTPTLAVPFYKVLIVTPVPLTYNGEREGYSLPRVVDVSDKVEQIEIQGQIDAYGTANITFYRDDTPFADGISLCVGAWVYIWQGYAENGPIFYGAYNIRKPKDNITGGTITIECEAPDFIIDRRQRDRILELFESQISQGETDVYGYSLYKLVKAIFEAYESAPLPIPEVGGGYKIPSPDKDGQYSGTDTMFVVRDLAWGYGDGGGKYWPPPSGVDDMNLGDTAIGELVEKKLASGLKFSTYKIKQPRATDYSFLCGVADAIGKYDFFIDNSVVPFAVNFRKRGWRRAFGKAYSYRISLADIGRSSEAWPVQTAAASYDGYDSAVLQYMNLPDIYSGEMIRLEPEESKEKSDDVSEDEAYWKQKVEELTAQGIVGSVNQEWNTDYAQSVNSWVATMRHKVEKTEALEKIVSYYYDSTRWSVSMQCTSILIPGMRERDIIYVENAPFQYNGYWFVTSVNHNVTPSDGYTTSFTAKRTFLNGSGVAKQIGEDSDKYFK